MVGWSNPNHKYAGGYKALPMGLIFLFSCMVHSWKCAIAAVVLF